MTHFLPALKIWKILPKEVEMNLLASAMISFIIFNQASVFGAELHLSDGLLAQNGLADPVTHLAESNNQTEPTKFSFKVEDEEYLVLSDGRGTRKRPGHGTEKFIIPVKEGNIEEIQYVNLGDRLVLIYQLTDGEDGWGALLCMNRKTLESKWQSEGLGFNIGQGLIEDYFLYITSIGFVAKLDLRSGQYIWKHTSLYKPSLQDEPAHFNAFHLPHLDGEFVSFTEAIYCTADKTKPSPRPCQPITLRVNKKTGQLTAQDQQPTETR